MEKDKTHNQIMYMLGEMSSDIKGLVRSLEKIDKLSVDHDTRIGAIERDKVIRETKAGVYGVVGGAVISAIAWFLR